MKKFLPKVTEVVFVLPVVALLLAFLVLSQHFISQKGEMGQGTLTQGIGLPPLPVSITSPKDGETVSGQVTVSLVNPLGRNFQKLEFWVDRRLEKEFDTTSAAVYDKLYEVNYKLDTTKFADGEHILSVIAQGMEGKYQTFAVKVNFANKQSFSTNKQSFSTNKQSFSTNKNLSFAQNLDSRDARIKQSFSTNKTAQR